LYAAQTDRRTLLRQRAYAARPSVSCNRAGRRPDQRYPAIHRGVSTMGTCRMSLNADLYSIDGRLRVGRDQLRSLAGACGSARSLATEAPKAPELA